MNKDTIKKLQEKELEILKEVDRLCKKNGIKYSLAYGSAIGAIRHQGFIPWDDDVDIMMSIENYKKFQSIVNIDLNSEKFYYQNYMTEKHGFLMWDKIRMNNTTSIIKGQDNIPIHYGICIDIFPLFKFPKNKKLQLKHIKLMKKSFILLDTELYNFGHKRTTFKGKIIYFIINLIPRKIRKKIIQKNIEKVSSYNGEFDKYVDYSDIYNRVLEYPKEIMNGFVDMKFENEVFPIIKQYDKFLKIAYGDYMKLPPKEERVAHGNLILDFEKSLDYKERKNKNGRQNY